MNNAELKLQETLHKKLSSGRVFKKLPILKLGLKLKTLIILYLSFEMELSEIKRKLRPLNMHPKVFSLTLAALFGNYWKLHFWS